MGTCLSKKKTKPAYSSAVSNGCAVAASPAPQPISAVVPLNSAVPKPKNDGEEAPAQAKKEVFLIKHRRSHENSKPSPVMTEEEESEPAVALPEKIAVVRTSSCTKEEVDAILIQCGRLSRSSSGKAASSSASIERGSGGGRRYSGSKRSYDFDQCGGEGGEDSAKNEIVSEEASEKRVGRHRRSSPSPQGRRRTPSRERDQNQRSSSRERRVSRSPGRRGSSSAETGEQAAVTNRPGKLVSVPATVSSLVMDRSNNGEPASGNVIKRISVKRNGGEGARTAASPRSQSPARANGKSSNEAQQQAGSLSRNGSKKAEHSPYRRNPLSEIDPNALAYPNQSSNRSQSRGKREAEGDEIIFKDTSNLPTQIQRNQGHKTTARLSTDNKSTTFNLVATALPQATVETTVVISDTKPPGLTRSRSGRRSRDFDFTPEALLSNANANATPSYTRLLLADIHNFHQKNSSGTTTNNTVVTLPACVSKACSILEAVADLNNNGTVSSAAGSSNIVATEVGSSDDLNEPSFHKYVTVRRGAAGYVAGEASDDQESSGSNSVAGSIGQANHWGGLSSSWEPNSADSTDRWSSGSKASGSGGVRSSGIGRGRLGSAKGLQATPVAAST